MTLDVSQLWRHQSVK